MRTAFSGNMAIGLTTQGGACAVFSSALSLVNCSLENNTAATISGSAAAGLASPRAGDGDGGGGDFLISALSDATLVGGVRAR